jgi:chitinase
MAALWCTGYFPGWEQDGMSASAIDYSVITHVIHFSAVPNPDGTLDTAGNTLSTANSAQVVQAAHNAGRKVLVCVGGAGTQTGFQGAASALHRQAFINNLVNLTTSRGYDGIDVDWEPLDSVDASSYSSLITGLRTALSAIPGKPYLLTAAVALPPTPANLLANLKDQFDQINLMTYDLSGPYPGWVTWFNSPIYDGSYRFASTGGLVPSVAGMVNTLLAAGVPAVKIGVGIPFYGYIWSGGAGTSTGGTSAPRQSWTTAPAATAMGYDQIVSTYYTPQNYHWDNAAQAAWLGIDAAGSANDKFISYDDVRGCQTKVSYARNTGLGGVMIWELAQDHVAGRVDPLLQGIKEALQAPGSITIQRDGSNISLAFSAAPLGSYRVEWSSNLTAPVWNTLALTNTPGPAQTLQIVDPSTPTNTQKFYRVRTAP